MQLEDRIDFLSGLISKYNVDDLNIIYKTIESAQAKTILSRARYSEVMARKIMAAAKRKNISKGRKEYIQLLKAKNEQYSIQTFLPDFEQQLLAFFQKNRGIFESSETIKELFFEHDYSPKSTKAIIQKNQNKEALVTIMIPTTIDFSNVWGFLVSTKFENFADVLEEISLEEEEYPQIFNELYKLRSYQIIKEVLQRAQIQSILKNSNIHKHFAIKIGEHDNWNFRIL